MGRCWFSCSMRSVSVMFMDEDFLLSTQTARALYHGAAEAMPIFDYHCHLDPREIVENRAFSTVTELESTEFSTRPSISLPSVIME